MKKKFKFRADLDMSTVMPSHLWDIEGHDGYGSKLDPDEPLQWVEFDVTAQKPDVDTVEMCLEDAKADAAELPFMPPTCYWCVWTAADKKERLREYYWKLINVPTYRRLASAESCEAWSWLYQNAETEAERKKVLGYY